VDQSLVQQRDANGEPRFTMLATLREFALEQVAASGEADALERQHAVYYTAVAERADAAFWQSGRLVADLREPLDPERDNLVAALAWALAQGEAELGLRLGGALRYWFNQRSPGEGLRWLEALLALPGAAATSLARGLGLAAAATCAMPLAESNAAVAYLEEAATCFRAVEDLPRLSSVLAPLGVNLPRDQDARALRTGEEALALARATGERYRIAYAETVLGRILLHHDGDLAAARAHLTEGLRLARALAADYLTALALGGLGQVLAAQGQRDEARRLLQEALALAAAIGDRAGVGVHGAYLALLAGEAGNRVQAIAAWRTALVQIRELSNRFATAFSLTGIALLLAADGQGEGAARLLGAVAAGPHLALSVDYFRRQLATAAAWAEAATRSALSEEAFAAAWAEGEALSLEQAADLALAALADLDGIQPVDPAVSA
jgi:tetratricopeptide (TPR) repeat protein